MGQGLLYQDQTCALRVREHLTPKVRLVFTLLLLAELRHRNTVS